MLKTFGFDIFGNFTKLLALFNFISHLFSLYIKVLAQVLTGSVWTLTSVSQLWSPPPPPTHPACFRRKAPLLTKHMCLRAQQNIPFPLQMTALSTVIKCSCASHFKRASCCLVRVARWIPHSCPFWPLPEREVRLPIRTNTLNHRCGSSNCDVHSQAGPWISSWCRNNTRVRF